MDQVEAQALQVELRRRVVVDVPLGREPRLVAGVDVAYESDAVGSPIAGGVVVLDLADLSIVEVTTASGAASFPYVPGLLAFREMPVLEAALGGLTTQPDVIVCDGYGIAHPRRFGLACHLGVVTGIPAFGVAKTPFIGTFTEPGPRRGDTSDLLDGGEVVGRVVRTQTGVKPVFVSAGHKLTLDDAVALALKLSRFRLPETTRHADRASRQALERLHR